MKRETLIKKKIQAYNPKGGLAQTAFMFLALAEINHRSTKAHVERVALLAEATAKKLKKDTKAAFFAGLLHDVAKLTLPMNLFDGHNISPEEYALVKKHAMDGFRVLKDLHLFTGLCAGVHHNLYKAGYGLTAEDFPSNWSPATIKKVLDTSMNVSVCDFVEAFTSRSTKILDGSGRIDPLVPAPDLKSMLYSKYPEEQQLVDIVLELREKVL